jgi:hypothetical protein
MNRFYLRLGEGEDTGSALRDAKLDLLAKYGEQVRPCDDCVRSCHLYVSSKPFGELKNRALIAPCNQKRILLFHFIRKLIGEKRSTHTRTSPEIAEHYQI